MTTKVIHITYGKDYPGFVYIGRPRKSLTGGWGNPIINKIPCPVCSSRHTEKGDTLPCYEIYLRDKLEHDTTFLGDFLKLRDKVLACFCLGPNHPTGVICHGQIMAYYLDNYCETFPPPLLMNKQ